MERKKHCPPLLAPAQQVSSSDSQLKPVLLSWEDERSGASSTEAGNARSPPLSGPSWAGRCSKSSIDITQMICLYFIVFIVYSFGTKTVDSNKNSKFRGIIHQLSRKKPHRSRLISNNPTKFCATIFFTLQQKIKDGPRGNGTTFKKCGGTFFGGSER